MKNEDQIKICLSYLGLGFVTGAIAGAGLAVARGMNVLANHDQEQINDESEQTNDEPKQIDNTDSEALAWLGFFGKEELEVFASTLLRDQFDRHDLNDVCQNEEYLQEQERKNSSHKQAAAHLVFNQFGAERAEKWYQSYEYQDVIASPLMWAVLMVSLEQRDQNFIDPDQPCSDFLKYIRYLLTQGYIDGYRQGLLDRFNGVVAYELASGKPVCDIGYDDAVAFTKNIDG